MRQPNNFPRRIIILMVAVVTLLGAIFSVPTSVTAVTGNVIGLDPGERPPGQVVDDRISQPESALAQTYNLGAYASDYTITQGESVDFHISTNVADPFSIDIYREGITRQHMQTIDDVTASVRNCTEMYDTGCNWPVAATLDIPVTWSSGVYTVDVPTSGGTTKAVFIVREDDPGSSSRILFVNSVNTWQCYNSYGGKSCYAYNSTDGVPSSHLSIDRPLVENNGGSYLMKFDRWEINLIKWAEAEGYALEYISDYDLDFEPEFLQAYDVVVIAGHSEYWSWNARQAVKEFINLGGRLVHLSGNTMWKQVRFEDDGRIMVNYRQTGWDPVQDPQLTTGPNWDQPINDSAYFVTGAYWLSGGYPLSYDQGYGGFWAQNTDHWAFAGTNLQENDLFGRNTAKSDSLHDKEADGVKFNCAPDGSTIIGPVPNTGTPENYTILGITPVDPGNGIDHNISAMGIYTVSGGGAAFNANTTGWSVALNGADQSVSQITKNVLDRFLASDVPEESEKADTDHLFVDRFNCNDLAQGNFPQTIWKNYVADLNYYDTEITDNLLTADCGIEGTGLKIDLGNSNDGMAYQSMVMPDWSNKNALRTSMTLNLSNTSLSEGAVFDLASFYDDPRLFQGARLIAALQLSRVNGDLAMRFQPVGENLPWRTVPTGEFFVLETVWDQPGDQVQIIIDGVPFQENIDLSAARSINRVDFGMSQASGTNSGSLCLDDFIIDELEKGIVINEIHYNPSPNQGSDDDFEFLELVNNSDGNISLDGFAISGDINFTFPASTSIADDEIILLAKNGTTYGGLSCQVFQWTSGSLSDSGGIVQLNNQGGNMVDIVEYDDEGEWPGYPNGDGPSLELAGLELDNSLAVSWHSSSAVGGSPCAANSNGTPVNDEFDSPKVIESVPYSDTLYAPGATTAVDDPALPCGPLNQGGSSVWYSFTPGTNGLLTADTFGSSNDTVLAIWQGIRGSLTSTACNNDTSGQQSQVVAVPLEGGTTYHIEIASFSGGLGVIDLNVNFSTGVAITQDIQLLSGWNLVSSYVVPGDRTLESLMGCVESDMVLMKNGAGQVYWPGKSINDIGNWDVREGYFIYMNNQATLSISGQQVDTVQTPIELLSGWNMISFLHETPTAIELALNNIASTLVLAKNGFGEVYWPYYCSDQIGDMQPNNGYQLYVKTPAMLVYP